MKIYILFYFILTHVSVAQANTCRQLFEAANGENAMGVRAEEVSDVTRTARELGRRPVQAIASVEVRSFLIQLTSLGWMSARQQRNFERRLDSALKDMGPKSSVPHFGEYMQYWMGWHKLMTDHLSKINGMSSREKRQYREKFEPLVHFALEHYLVFLKTNKADFNFERMFSVIRLALESPHNMDTVWFIYNFEKYVRRFSSEREFRLCR